ncbi:aldose epimerase family protein [Falsirhodobacter sp. alg1]|uniref:aldose epimerase family protein n=1 Tax=Falsirhodobacter sp. alg1 TaxID=1472418 RepID=UPI0005EEC084|nr:aldose epimerase family protein [Falsirhodobacter sp. alg1]
MDTLQRDVFGHMPDGQVIERVTLAADGIRVAIITFGAAIQSLQVPDRAGRMEEVVLGHDSLQPYLAKRSFFGATVGRYANRIAGSRFALDGQTHRLDGNEGGATLHGGYHGFDQRVWQIGECNAGPHPSVTFHLQDSAGSGGFPGTLQVALTYTLGPGPQIKLSYCATTDAPTVLNLTHHGFFALGGDVRDQMLAVRATRYLPTDTSQIPLAPEPVAGTPFDLTQAARIGGRLEQDHPQLRAQGGFDHYYPLDDGAEPAARLWDPASGRVMEVLTDQPGIQVYTANTMNGFIARNGAPLHPWDAICLEAQDYPDAPNRPDFPSPRLDPGETYSRSIKFRFAVIP